MVALCREVLSVVAGNQIAGICVSGAGPCFVLCDDDDRPVRPAILYGIDMRATEEIGELTDRYGAQEKLDLTDTAADL